MSDWLRLFPKIMGFLLLCACAAASLGGIIVSLASGHWMIAPLLFLALGCCATTLVAIVKRSN